MLITYSFLNIFDSSQYEEQDWGSNKKAYLLSLENYENDCLLFWYSYFLHKK